MRVLCVTPWFPAFPGDQSGSFIYDSLTGAKGLGADFTVLVSQPWRPRLAGLFSADWRREPLDPQLFADQLHIDHVHYISIPRNHLRKLSNEFYRRRLLPRLKSLIAEWKPDVIHAHTEVAGCVAVEAGLRWEVPSVVTLHGQDTSPRLNTPRQLRFYKTWLSKADRVVLVGRPLWEHFEEVIGRSDHFRILANGFSLPLGDVEAPPLRWHQPLRIVSLSNLHEGKGVDIALRALHCLAQDSQRSWTFKIVGDGAERPRLERLTDELGLRDQVQFVGACAHSEVASHLKDQDVFLLPSYREAFGIAYLEAMAMGLLAIGVEGQGPSAFIEHMVTGLLVKPCSVPSVVSCLKCVLDNQDSMLGIAAAGLHRVRTEYSWCSHAKKLLGLYSEVMEGKS